MTDIFVQQHPPSGRWKVYLPADTDRRLLTGLPTQARSLLTGLYATREQAQEQADRLTALLTAAQTQERTG